ncbi:unnamed protein product [Rhizophagus irregularis]|uniref:Uncharacterized protein n=1 Tax=Rhizophagus irregularis TaxID=588596 RepID=A0A916E4C8_9GLOM|nr:unnamed protein product [Rhizophagus irregularis]
MDNNLILKCPSFVEIEESLSIGMESYQLDWCGTELEPTNRFPSLLIYIHPSDAWDFSDLIFKSATRSFKNVDFGRVGLWTHRTDCFQSGMDVWNLVSIFEEDLHWIISFLNVVFRFSFYIKKK